MHPVVQGLQTLGDKLAAEIDESESRGSITDEAARLLREAGVIRMLQPKDYGGDEAHPREFFEVLMELAARAPSIGWVSGVVGVQGRLGVRAPLAPPLGALFVGSPNGISEQAWLARLGDKSGDAVLRAKAQLARVRQRGWSISLLGDVAPDELEAAIERYSCPHRTPEQERHFFSTVSRMFDMHEPLEIDLDRRYDVLHLSVPVKRPGGETVLLLRISELPAGLSGRQLGQLVERLRTSAAKVESMIARIPLTSRRAAMPLPACSD